MPDQDIDEKMPETKQIFEILMRENSQMLLTYLRSSVSPTHVVDELFQETMLTAWQKLHSFDNTRPLGPWLRGIAKNHLLAHYRKSKQEILICNEQTLDYLEQAINQIDQQAGDSWQQKVAPLNDCIQKLPEKYRTAIEARFIHNQKPQAISLMFNISPEALKKRLQRAKKLLFNCLNTKIPLEAENE